MRCKLCYLYYVYILCLYFITLYIIITDFYKFINILIEPNYQHLQSLNYNYNFCYIYVIFYVLYYLFIIFCILYNFNSLLYSLLSIYFKYIVCYL